MHQTWVLGLFLQFFCKHTNTEKGRETHTFVHTNTHHTYKQSEKKTHTHTFVHTHKHIQTERMRYRDTHKHTQTQTYAFDAVDAIFARTASINK